MTAGRVRDVLISVILSEVEGSVQFSFPNLLHTAGTWERLPVPAKFHFALFNFCHPELVEGSAPGRLAIFFWDLRYWL
jgi:hypothetical protein